MSIQPVCPSTLLQLGPVATRRLSKERGTRDGIPGRAAANLPRSFTPWELPREFMVDVGVEERAVSGDQKPPAVDPKQLRCRG